MRSLYSARVALIWAVRKEFFPRFTKRNLLQTPIQKIAEGLTEKSEVLTSLSLSISRGKDGRGRKKVGLWSGRERRKIENMSFVLERSIFFS